MTGLTISEIVFVLTTEQRPEIARYHKRENRWIIFGYSSNDPLPEIKYWMHIILP